MIWRIEWEDQARRELRKLDAPIQREILRYLRERVVASENPYSLGKPLQGRLSGFWRYRLRDYRIICTLKDDRCVVLVVHVAHRRLVYD